MSHEEEGEGRKEKEGGKEGGRGIVLVGVVCGMRKGGGLTVRVPVLVVMI